MISGGCIIFHNAKKIKEGENKVVVNVIFDLVLVLILAIGFVIGIKNGFIKTDRNAISLTEKGFWVSNTLITDLLF